MLELVGGCWKDSSMDWWLLIRESEILTNVNDNVNVALWEFEMI